MTMVTAANSFSAARALVDAQSMVASISRSRLVNRLNLT
jgi:hypothetical protein